MSSSVLIVAAASLAAASVGYCLGSKSNLPVPLPPIIDAKPLDTKELPETPVAPTSAPAPAPATAEEATDSDDDEEGADVDLKAVSAGLFEECKLVLVVRSDLGMTKGKIAAQCGHATLACYKALEKTNPALLKHWEHIGQAKVALRCDSEDELLLLQATAQSLNLCARVIRDAGRTQIASGSQTVLGIGPGPVKLINQVTGKLKLL
ncbi:hypothetical protein FRB95_012912 [Tulasnella sp. JGI-2019a]|nr:hypothetical protein FRB95_012912 [Tulasnella sp. JGI-2019a]